MASRQAPPPYDRSQHRDAHANFALLGHIHITGGVISRILHNHTQVDCHSDLKWSIPLPAEPTQLARVHTHLHACCSRTNHIGTLHPCSLVRIHRNISPGSGICDLHCRSEKCDFRLTAE